jgi:hypothetical protein
MWFLFLKFLIFFLGPLVKDLVVLNFVIQFKLMILCFLIWSSLFWFLIFSYLFCKSYYSFQFYPLITTLFLFFMSILILIRFNFLSSFYYFNFNTHFFNFYFLKSFCITEIFFLIPSFNISMTRNWTSLLF